MGLGHYSERRSMGATGVPLVVVSLNQAAGLVVPELTRSAGIKLNPRVSLHFRGWQLVIHSPGRCAPWSRPTGEFADRPFPASAGVAAVKDAKKTKSAQRIQAFDHGSPAIRYTPRAVSGSEVAPGKS